MDFIIQLIAKLPWQLSVLIAASGAVFADYLGKIWSTNQRGYLFIFALIGYMISGLFYLPTLLKNGLVLTSVVWSVLAIIGFLFVGLVLFNETLTQRQIIGVVLGVIALVILSY